MNEGYETRDEIIEYIKRHEMTVQVKGPCPICGTGRSQYGECWHGHIVFVNPFPVFGIAPSAETKGHAQ